MLFRSVSPGIDFIYDQIPGLKSSEAQERVPHAWKAGPQTVALRKQLEASTAKEDSGLGGPLINLSDALQGTIARGIAEITKMDPAKIKLTDALSKDLGLDSLTFVEVVGQVEKRFQTRIEGVDFATIVTVQDLVGVLQFAANKKRKFQLFDRVFFADFSPEANQRIVWRVPRRFANSIIRVMLRLRHGLEVEGLENLEGGGPFVFTPNHSSHFDLLSIAGSLPHEIGRAHV